MCRLKILPADARHADGADNHQMTETLEQMAMQQCAAAEIALVGEGTVRMRFGNTVPLRLGR